MSNSPSCCGEPRAHIALFPSAGMGHLTPFLRIAGALLSRGCRVTLITAGPTVSAAESSHISSFLSRHPQVHHSQFQTLRNPAPSPPPAPDPFFVQFEAICRSARTLLRPLLAPPLSALFADFAVISAAAPVAAELGIPCYAVCTSSVSFLCLAAHLPALLARPGGLAAEELRVPGLASPLPSSSLPPPLKDPTHVFTSVIITNAEALSLAKGIIVNSFDRFEPETLEAVNNGRALESLPKVIPIGPLEMSEENEEEEEEEKYMTWLDDQPEESVVYVSFGSRTAMSRDQIRELAEGLDKSGHRFLWVLKTSKVDKDEDGEELRGLLGESFLERTRGRGVALKGWVRQREILGHRAVGAFVNHCGWNSVTEAARSGVPVVAWPQHGDQRINAEVVERAGLGVWERGWDWCGQGLVGADEIGKKIRAVMGDERLRETARKVGFEADKAVGPGGTSDKAIIDILEFLHNRN